MASRPQIRVERACASKSLERPYGMDSSKCRSGDFTGEGRASHSSRPDGFRHRSRRYAASHPLAVLYGLLPICHEIRRPGSFESVAVVYPACRWRGSSSWPSWIVAHRGPNRGAGVTRQGCYRPDAVSGRPKGHGFRHSLCTPGERDYRRLRRLCPRVRDILCPDRPDDPPQFVGHRNRRLVVAAPLAEVQGPSMQAGGGRPPAAVRRKQHRAGAVRE